MDYKIEIGVSVIVHATEDISKIFQSFEDVLNLKKEDFMVSCTTGHFDNPISILNAKIDKKRALDFMKNFIRKLSNEQINQLVEEIEERIVDSRFHMRINKQELTKENIVLGETDSIKIKIHTPIYNKKDTLKKFTEIFQSTY